MRARWGTFAAVALAGAVALGVPACSRSDDNAAPIVTGVPGTGLTTGSSAGASTEPAPGTTAGTVPDAPTLTDGSTISTVGLDKVTFGMTVDEAQAALGTTLVADEPKNPSCYTAHPAAGTAGVSFLVSDGRVERAEVTAGKIGTRSGAHLGSTATDITTLYGDRIQSQPRPDGQPGTWLVYVPKDEADAKFRIVFVTDGATVTAIRAGRLPQVLATSGCA